MAPCLIGYGAIAHRLVDDPKTVTEGNRYWKWIETYAGADYDEAVAMGSGVYFVLQCICRCSLTRAIASATGT